MSKRPVYAPHRQPGRDANADLAGMTTDELAVVAAGCEYLSAQLWQQSRINHCEIDRLLERQNAALRLLGKARRQGTGQGTGQGAPGGDPGD